jgi:ankyrin repeat protein
LLDHGADVNARGFLRLTPLHNAAFYGLFQPFQMLIEHNADIHSRNDLGLTPLHSVASPIRVDITPPDFIRDHLDIMQLLLDHGADPNARDNDNATPLHHSSWWQKEPFVAQEGTVEGTRLLLKHGAIIDAEDNNGETPLQVAFKNERYNIVACLREHGAWYLGSGPMGGRQARAIKEGRRNTL